MAKKYIVELTEEERTELGGLIHKGKGSARKMTRARILLLADEGKTDVEIAEALQTSVSTVEQIRQRFVEGNLEGTLNDRASLRPRKTSLDDAGRAILVSVACSSPPAEEARWTLKLLAGRLVEMAVVESISRETVRCELKKINLSLGASNNGAFPK
jgi:transposase